MSNHLIEANGALIDVSKITALENIRTYTSLMIPKENAYMLVVHLSGTTLPIYGNHDELLPIRHNLIREWNTFKNKNWKKIKQ